MSTIKLGETVIHLSSVDSTNTYATSLLHQEDVAEGTVILADYQLKGKGQQGNHWISDKNSNLLFSFILRPGFLLAERQYYLSMCICNGICDFMTSITKGCKIKWPNDILLDGKKVAGILIENTIMGEFLQTSVIGIGLNVNQRSFPADLPNPTSLSLFTGSKHKLDKLFPTLIQALTVSVNQLYAMNFAAIKTAYLNNLWKLNEWTRFTDVSGQFEGRIADVSDLGELIVTLRNGGIKRYIFKEIGFDVAD